MVGGTKDFPYREVNDFPSEVPTAAAIIYETVDYILLLLLSVSLLFLFKQKNYCEDQCRPCSNGKRIINTYLLFSWIYYLY